ncbi:MAG: hypothetical protein ACI4EO_05190 [Blautia sp.]
MKEIWDLTKYMWELYRGQGWYLSCFLVAVVFLFLKRKENKKAKFLSAYSVVMLFLFWCPVSAKLIMDYGIGRSVYWRVFWLLPIPLLIGWVLTSVVFSTKRKSIQILLLAGSLVLTAAGGTWIYREEVFQKTDNVYKIPQTVIPICQEMRDYPQEERIKAAVADELLPYIRQYDPGIHMVYGRNTTKDFQAETMEAAVLYGVLHEEHQDRETFVSAIELAECNFLVLKGEHPVKRWADLEYEMLLEVDGYYLYYTG